MRKINEFFFPLEEGEKLSFHDGLWFYGTLSAAIILTVVVVIKTW